MRRLHWSTWAGAAAGALAALLFLGPVAVAVVLLRCCDDSRGPTALAWVVIGLVLAAVLAAAAVAGALLFRLVRRLLRRPG